jgi:predicted alpha-1,6-mannanase (GH76 family)
VVEAVDSSLTAASPAGQDSPGASIRSRVLQCAGTGDGGLFTGILCRYLALAAADPRLPEHVRATAARLVLDTAESFWLGRRHISAAEPLARHVSRNRGKHQGIPLFSVDPQVPADATYPPGAVVELSSQLQAWMVLEAAASIKQKARRN